MIVYQVNPCIPGHQWFATLSDAQKHCRQRAGLITTLEIHQFNLMTDKDDLILLLNGSPTFRGDTEVRVWRFTKRGGCFEVDSRDVVTAMPAEAGASFPEDSLVSEQAGASDDLDVTVDSPALNPAKQAQVAQEMAEWRSRNTFRGTDAAKLNNKTKEQS